jgi:hypothetical protein
MSAGHLQVGSVNPHFKACSNIRAVLLFRKVYGLLFLALRVCMAVDCLNVASSFPASSTITITRLQLAGAYFSGFPERGSLATSLSSPEL